VTIPRSSPRKENWSCSKSKTGEKVAPEKGNARKRASGKTKQNNNNFVATIAIGLQHLV
jgi:hypothetical protein